MPGFHVKQQKFFNVNPLGIAQELWNNDEGRAAE